MRNRNIVDQLPKSPCGPNIMHTAGKKSMLHVYETRMVAVMLNANFVKKVKMAPHRKRPDAKVVSAPAVTETPKRVSESWVRSMRLVRSLSMYASDMQRN